MATEVCPALVTEEEARRYLGDVSRSLLYRLRAEGLIQPVHLLGRAVRYSLVNLDEAIRRLQGHREAESGRDGT